MARPRPTEHRSGEDAGHLMDGRSQQLASPSVLGWKRIEADAASCRRPPPSLCVRRVHQTPIAGVAVVAHLNTGGLAVVRAAMIASSCSSAPCRRASPPVPGRPRAPPGGRWAVHGRTVSWRKRPNAVGDPPVLQRLVVGEQRDRDHLPFRRGPRSCRRRPMERVEHLEPTARRQRIPGSRQTGAVPGEGGELEPPDAPRPPPGYRSAQAVVEVPERGQHRLDGVDVRERRPARGASGRGGPVDGHRRHVAGLQHVTDSSMRSSCTRRRTLSHPRATLPTWTFDSPLHSPGHIGPAPSRGPGLQNSPGSEGRFHTHDACL